MNATATKHRDPLKTRADLLDMTARLQNLSPSASLEQRFNTLDSIFHDLAAMAMAGDNPCPATAAMAAQMPARLSTLVP